MRDMVYLTARAHSAGPRAMVEAYAMSPSSSSKNLAAETLICLGFGASMGQFHSENTMCLLSRRPRGANPAKRQKMANGPSVLDIFQEAGGREKERRRSRRKRLEDTGKEEKVGTPQIDEWPMRFRMFASVERPPFPARLENHCKNHGF